MPRKKIEPKEPTPDVVLALNQIAEILLMLQRHLNVISTVIVCQHAPKLKPGVMRCATCRVGLEEVDNIK